MEQPEVVTLDDNDCDTEVAPSLNHVEFEEIGVKPYDGAVNERSQRRWTGKKARKRRSLVTVLNEVLCVTPDADWNEDFYYFDAYSHHAIHEVMLKDKVRTLTYRKAIELNKHLFQGKTVLDVGCGTGILSMFAARAGAARVIGIDFSDMAFFAHQIVKDNGLDSKVTILHGKVEDVEELPYGIKNVDIIISEWMGYSLLMESMLETVLYARQKFLKCNGTLMPDKCSLFITGMDDGGARERKLRWLKSGACEFDMSHIAKMKHESALVFQVPPEQIVTTHYELLEIDLNMVFEEELTFDLPFNLEVTQDRRISALVTFFTVDFSRCHTKVGFSTAPEAEPTHWKQTVFYLKTPIQAIKGEVVKGVFMLRKYWKNHRGLHISIEVEFEGKLMSTKEFNDYDEHTQAVAATAEIFEMKLTKLYSR